MAQDTEMNCPRCQTECHLKVVYKTQKVEIKEWACHNCDWTEEDGVVVEEDITDTETEGPTNVSEP